MDHDWFGVWRGKVEDITQTRTILTSRIKNAHEEMDKFLEHEFCGALSVHEEQYRVELSDLALELRERLAVVRHDASCAGNLHSLPLLILPVGESYELRRGVTPLGAPVPMRWSICPTSFPVFEDFCSITVEALTPYIPAIIAGEFNCGITVGTGGVTQEELNESFYELYSYSAWHPTIKNLPAGLRQPSKRLGCWDLYPGGMSLTLPTGNLAYFPDGQRVCFSGCLNPKYNTLHEPTHEERVFIVHRLSVPWKREECEAFGRGIERPVPKVPVAPKVITPPKTVEVPKKEKFKKSRWR